MLDWIDDKLLPDTEDHDSVRSWRMRMFFVACSSSMMLWFVVLPALFGIPYPLPSAVSPAWATELDPIKNDQKLLKEGLADVQLTLLEGQIMQAQDNLCGDVKNGGNGNGWRARILDLQRRYEKIKGRFFEGLPPCNY